MKPLAIILIVVGAIMMIVTGLNLTTKKEVVDLGKIEINKTENHPIRWSPIIGVALLVAGIGVLVANRKKAI